SKRIDNLELNIRAAHTFISRLEGRMDDMSEVVDALKAEVAKLKDAVAANASSVEQLRKAYEYLRDHPKVIEVIKDDPALAGVVAHIGDATAKLGESVAKAGASGGVEWLGVTSNKSKQIVSSVVLA